MAKPRDEGLHHIGEVSKTKNMAWAGNVARMQTTAMFTKCKSENNNNNEKCGRSWRSNTKCFLKRSRTGVDWIKLAHNMVLWRNVAQAVKKLRDVQGRHYIRQITSVTSPHNCTVV